MSYFSTKSEQEQVAFKRDNDGVRFVLNQQAYLSFYSASSLKQQCVGRHVAPYEHIILISSQPSLFLLVNTVHLVEKQQIPILSCLVLPDLCSYT